MGPSDYWIRTAKDALANHEIIRRDDHRIEATARTGSRYVVYAVPASDAEMLVVVRHPWIGAYEMTIGAYCTPSYFIYKWGPLNVRDPYTLHGGDVYALLHTVSLIVPRVTYPSPEECAL